MKRVYSDDDFNAIVDQKNRVLRVFWGVSIAYAIVCIASLVYHISLPYAHSMQWLPKTTVYVASGLFVVFCSLYLGIKYHRVKRYYKMMYYLSAGLKNVEENYFECFEFNALQKDGVDAVSCVFKTWNAKKSEWMKREAYWDMEKHLPPFKRDDKVRYVVQSNFIVAYEVTEEAESNAAEKEIQTTND